MVSPDIFGALSAEALRTKEREFDFQVRIFRSKAEAERRLPEN